MYKQTGSSNQATQSISDLLSTIMVLCQGTDESGKAFWAYVCISPSMAKAFNDARATGQFDLADYGTIIESGAGESVPAEVQERMARDYGARHDFEDHLANAVEKIKNNYLS